MARVRLDASEINNSLAGELQTRARSAVTQYRRARLIRDSPGYPFAQRSVDGSIRDPSTTSVRRTARGVRIRSTARGARFIEGGNDAGGSQPFITGNLALPLQGRARSYRRAQRGAKVVIGENGQAYALVRRVRTYSGRRLLENAVRRAFGIRTTRL